MASSASPEASPTVTRLPHRDHSQRGLQAGIWVASAMGTLLVVGISVWVYIIFHRRNKARRAMLEGDLNGDQETVTHPHETSDSVKASQ